MGWLLLGAALLGGCSTHRPAPVEDLSGRPQTQEVPVDGLYQVRRGDSLHAIAFRFGLDHRDIAAWNGLDQPDLIHPGQVLRLSPPPGRATVAAAPSRPAAQTRPLPPPRATTRPQRVPESTPAPVRPAPDQTAAPAQTAPATRPAPAVSVADPDGWIWPVSGRLLRTFKAGDPSRNGLDIAGSEGDPIRAAASGEVVYSGSGLIGYGELVIVKHSEGLLSAYAHNRRRLVGEGESVRQGQTIAEMGRNDRDQSLLHFEIRRDGRPVDPLNYLPKQ